ncbi:ephrin-B2 isoform X2 [Prorops nasuta]|uniref:ephrin-B2 isoform X2 n=1 Tax=Prorops nasuta TaxID=863751 RepID=UPI0034CFC69E
MMPWSILFLLLLVVMEAFPREATCSRLPDIYWNYTNPIFRIDNTDNIIDVNKNNAAYEYDQVNIICPVYHQGTYNGDVEKYIIYNVSKEEYEACRITNPDPKVIAVCDKPNTTLYFTITFRPFSPQPGGLEFLPGHDYYFISTSTKEDLHKRIGGRCDTHNMKVVFKVCCNNETSSSSATMRNNSVAVTSSTVPSSSSTSTAVLGGGGAAGMVPPHPPSVHKGGDRFYPGGSIYHHRDHHQPASAAPTLPPLANYPPYTHHSQLPIHNGSPVFSPTKTTITQKKKNKEYSNHPNEVVKNEELTYNAGSTYGSQNRLSRTIQLLSASLLTSLLLPTLLR